MIFFLRVIWVVIGCVWIANLAHADAPREVKMAVISWDGEAARLADYKELREKLATRAAAPVRLKIAVGTYSEVMHWLDRGLVDVAVLTPAAFSQTRPLSDSGPNCDYLLSQNRRDIGEFSDPIPTDFQNREWRGQYRSVCLVPQNSPLKSADDLLREAKAGRVRFLFVDPRSASGAIVPMLTLKEMGVDYRDRFVFTYGHNDSLNILAERETSDAGPLLVAFTFSRRDPSQRAAEGRVRELDIPGLKKSDRLIPSDVWVSRANFDARWIKQALLESMPRAEGLGQFSDVTANASPQSPEALAKLRAHFANCLSWSKSLQVNSEFDAPMTLEQIQWLIQHDQRNGKPVRLAVVLTGGGARCSYQAGALAVIEQTLAAPTAFPTDAPRPRIALVCGTSGGALNTVPASLAISATPEGAKALQDVWRGLAVQKMIRPRIEIRILLGLIIAWICERLVGAWVWGIRRQQLMRNTGDPSRIWRVRVALLLTAAAIILLVFYVPSITPLNAMSQTRGGLYLALACYYGSRWAAVFLLIAAALRAIWEKKIKPAQSGAGAKMMAWRQTPAWSVASFAVAFAIPLVLLASTGLRSGALIEDAAMKPTLYSAYSGLLSHESVEAKKPENIGVTILKNPARRDMLVTGSIVAIQPTLPRLRDDDATGSIYFYAPGAASIREKRIPGFAGNGFCLTPDSPDALRYADPQKLLDFVLGSGTIYPFFPSRKVTDFPTLGETSELIDGSFAHNSPIEAAVLWGATHIINLSVAPASEPGPSSNAFLSNLGIAVNYLYDQAQLTDAAAREWVPVFTLRPHQLKDGINPPGSLEANYPSIIDFSTPFVNYAIALGELNASQAGFEREKARPIFRIRESDLSPR